MDWSARFFEQRRLTSKIKHLVLQGYVKEFAYHLGSARPVVYYIDGFAGAGGYSHGSVHEDGSPLLIARLAQQIRGSAKPFDLRCLNVEANRKRFASLDGITEAPVCFHLVFATQNEKGLFEMNDVMVDALRTFNREVYSDSFFPIFEDEYERQVGRVAVENELLTEFAGKPSFTIDDVKRHCMQKTDLLLRGGEYRATVIKLAKTGTPLKKLDPGQASNANTRFKVVASGRQPKTLLSRSCRFRCTDQQERGAPVLRCTGPRATATN